MAEQAVAKKKGFARIAEYFKGVGAELKKVAWPTKKETYKYTLVVIVVCLLFALLFWVLDTAFLALLGLIIK